MVNHKHATFENDSYYFVIEKSDRLIPSTSAYYHAKRKAFKERDASKEAFFDHCERPSLAGIAFTQNLQGSVYTVAATLKNGASVKHCVEAIKVNLSSSRRCVLNFNDTLRDYLNDSIDTSCLMAIHYFKDTAKLIFRASDMGNELLIDLNLIKEFFLDPVFEENPVEVHVFASTAQNTINPIDFIQ